MIISPAKMLLKSSLLLLFAASIGDVHSFTPFDLVDNYVEQFEAHVDQLGKLAEEYRFVQQEYDTLSLEDSKLLLSKYCLKVLFKIFTIVSLFFLTL